MEDISVKAIIIGVSLFITIVTLSVIVLYFNTARQAADAVNQRMDIARVYDEVINREKFEGELFGVDVRSLINHYASDRKVIIQYDIDGNGVADLTNINKDWLNAETGVISESMLNSINPVSKYMITKNYNASNSITYIMIQSI